MVWLYLIMYRWPAQINFISPTSCGVVASYVHEEDKLQIKTSDQGKIYVWLRNNVNYSHTDEISNVQLCIKIQFFFMG